MFDEVQTSKEELVLKSIKYGTTFCPMCGTKNNFETIENQNTKIFQCRNCAIPLDALWDDYYQKKIKVRLCSHCASVTFADKNYCINCGTKIATHSEMKTKTTKSKMEIMIRNRVWAILTVFFTVVFYAIFIIINRIYPAFIEGLTSREYSEDWYSLSVQWGFIIVIIYYIVGLAFSLILAYGFVKIVQRFVKKR